MKPYLFVATALVAIAPFATAPEIRASSAIPAPDATIRVHLDQTANRITRWMYGACIEDVNHEIYGGLYAQRIFGESFEEPPNEVPVTGWTRFGGNWRIADDALRVDADAGAKLVRDAPVMLDGTVSCDVWFEDAQGENAGLILRVSDPRVGADNWTGYEISLGIRDQALILGRHRRNWEPLQRVTCPLAPRQWHRLRVALSGATLRIFVGEGARPLMEYTDAHPLGPGRVGVRTWNANAAFRRFAATGPRRFTDAFQRPEPVKRGGVSGMWDAVSTGSARARYAWSAAYPFNTAHSQLVTHLGGKGSVGIANRGLNRWGIAVRRGQPMAGSLYLRGSKFRGPVTVALQSADGSRTYASGKLAMNGGSWSRREFTLTPTASDANARFTISLDRPGTVELDQVFLSGTGATLFRGLPMRADIGEKLVAGGLTFMRYGGTMVNAPEYRWKTMIGPREKRPQYRGHWYAPASNGFGIEDFLQFCEKAGFEPAFAINIEETPEDAADLVEYLNGPATSTWGRVRAANGHPEPYNVRTIQIGNEEAIGGDPAEYAYYLERFKRLYAAMRPRDPRVSYVIAAWWRPDEPMCKRIAQELDGKAALWDVHVNADGLRDAEFVDRDLTRMRALFAEWIPGTTMRACIFEENGNRHDFQRALGHARVLNVVQRHGDFVLMDCAANALQPLGQNDNGWDQGQVFFLPDQVWAMPPYFAQQMAAENHLPLRVAAEVESPNRDLDITATRSEDGKTLVLKVVNSGAAAHAAMVRLGGFVPAGGAANVWTLSANLSDVNTPEAPDRIRPVASRLDLPAAEFTYTFPRHSYTVIRMSK